MLKNKIPKLLIAVLLLNTITQQLAAQSIITPNNATTASYTTIPIALPSNYSNSINLNFVRTWDAVAPFQQVSDVISDSRTVSQVKQTTQYVDGLGRPIQVVVKQASYSTNNGQYKDIVSNTVYDDLGREAIKYLPYTSTANTGKFKLNAFTEMQSSLSSQYPGEQFFYNKTIFEASPLNRPLHSYSAGNSWVGSQRGISSTNAINIANEVLIWNISNNQIIPQTNGYYAAGELYKSITADEKNTKVIEYKDKDGQVLLKKVQISNTVNDNNHAGWLCTYYIYDDFNRLRFVIPPKAVELILPNLSITNAIANDLCFQYQYDERGRMISKKVPGAGVVQMVYDNRDRLVMVQDGYQASNNFHWVCTVYDELNRPKKTFIYEWDDTRENIQIQIDANINYLSSIGYNELLTETFYDNYNWLSTVNSGLNSNLDYTFINGPNYLSSYNTAPLYAQQVVASNANLGMPTGSRIKVLGTNQYLYSLTLYDDKGRPIQNKATNHKGGISIATTQYDFSGKVLRSHLLHTNPSANDNKQVCTIMQYDAAGRLSSIAKSIDNQPAKIIVQNEYNELGQLKLKKLGSTNNDAATPIETLAYDYNIRGWLTGINKNYVAPTNPLLPSNNYFGMQLSYDYGFSKNQYNGNIAGTIWKSKGSGEQRAYGFDYDNANRLLKADFTQNNSGWNTSAGIDFSMKMGDGINHQTAYDANGNIKAMIHIGLLGTTSSIIDQLTYNYKNNETSNQLLNVTDAITTQTNLGDFKNGTNTSDDYSYDVNGNLVLDGNKAISNISYNHLNLPQTITVTGKGTITYTYDAAGNKLQKQTIDNTTNPSKTTTTDYINDFVYETVNTTPSKLQFFGHEEGRVRAVDNAGLTNYVYDYFVKDHLGNVRTTLTEEEKIDVYHAGFEEDYQTFDQQLFSNYINLVQKPNCFVSPGYGDGEETENNILQLVGAAKTREPMVVGVGKVLKVMAGDKVNASAYGWFSRNIINNQPINNLTPLTTLVTNLFSAGITGIGESRSFGTNGNSVIEQSINNFLSNQNNYEDDGAYLNWILLDEEQLKLVNNSSGYESFMKVLNENTENCSSTVLQANGGDGIDIKKNGYLYIYVSNTNRTYPVYFDDIHIEHHKGALLEETTYYPFGLTMSGISSKAAGEAPKNKYGITSKEKLDDEFSDGSGLEWYDFGARFYDQQIGKWHVIDPLGEKYPNTSPYNYCVNNPIRYVDLDGMDWIENKNTGDVEWRKDATKNNVPKGWNYVGTEYKGVTIREFNTKNFDDGKGGSFPALEIKIGYKDPNSGKATSFNWVQTVERDNSGKPFVDYEKTQAGQDNYPYYQDISENAEYTNKDGYNTSFYDMPNERDKNGSFKAELSLIGKPDGVQVGSKVYNSKLLDKKGMDGVIIHTVGKNVYSPIVTMKYGFSVNNGQMTTAPIKIVSPSSFQSQTIKQIH